MTRCKSCNTRLPRFVSRRDHDRMGGNLRERCRDCVLGIVNKPKKKARVA